jgi:hypothetical protein
MAKYRVFAVGSDKHFFELKSLICDADHEATAMAKCLVGNTLSCGAVKELFSGSREGDSTQ